MHLRAEHRSAVGLACCLALVACGTDSNENRVVRKDGVESERPGSLELNLANRTITLPIGTAIDNVDRQKFVQVEIGQVRNPKRTRVSFEVDYRRDDGTRVFLGAFGLYPPDRPGTFIVPTKGALRNEGAIAVSMQVLDEVGTDDEVRVEVKRISFREE